MLTRTRNMLVERGMGDALTDGRVRLWLGTLESEAEKLGPHAYDLFHAGFVLPFVRPHAFEQVWQRLVASLREGGVFSGQFFGPNDEFIRGAAHGEMTSHRSAEIDQLFAGWNVLLREEVNREGAIGRGKAKWWHVHHVVAVKLRLRSESPQSLETVT